MAPLTLVTTRSAIQIHLMDTTGLVWTTTIIDEAIRAALREMSRTYDLGYLLELSGLDGAITTTIEIEDSQVLIDGGVAYSLTFRAVGRYEEASPSTAMPPHLAEWAEARMNAFHAQLTAIDLRIRAAAAAGTADQVWMDSVREDEQLHDIAMQTAKHNHELAIQTADQVYNDTVIAANEAHELAIQAAQHLHEDDFLDNQQVHEADIQTAEHAQQTAIQAADQAHKVAIQTAQHAHELALLTAKQNYADALAAAETARLSGLQNAAVSPFSEWEWEEGDSFS